MAGRQMDETWEIWEEEDEPRRIKSRRLRDHGASDVVL